MYFSRESGSRISQGTDLLDPYGMNLNKKAEIPELRIRIALYVVLDTQSRVVLWPEILTTTGTSEERINFVKPEALQ